jgi:ribosomal-protein-alanine N-acetyltransferase
MTGSNIGPAREAGPDAAEPLLIEAGTVRLRDFTRDDVDAALAIVGDDRVTQWLSFDSRDRDGAARMIEGAIAAAGQRPRTEYYLAVTPADTDQLIGFGRLAVGGSHAAKLGGAVNADHWGHGYATAIAAGLINFGFATLGLHRITAAIGPENKRSIRLVQRLGFTHEGRLRDHVHTNGAWRDSLLYSILSTDPKP